MERPVVVVTGAGTGIGQAICTAFAGRGGRIVAVGRREENLAQTKALVEAAGGQCLIHPADVARAPLAAAVMAAAVERFGRVDVLVNNAALAVCAAIDDIDLQAFDAMLAVNAAGVVYTCKAAWPVMKRCGGGTIVNISSMAAVDPLAGLTAYGATKAFVNLLTKGLAVEGKPHNISVFAVGPGAVGTAMLRGTFPEFPAEKALEPAAVAEVVVTLTEPAARYCTGQTIYVRK